MSETTLLLRLEAPMQSWGVSSRFSERDTCREPSKSGIVGMLCAALGRPRNEPVDDLAALPMAVRVDREGRLLRDYQTSGGGQLPAAFAELYGRKNRDYGVSRASGAPGDTDVSNRYYLADACFLVGLGGSKALLGRLYEALSAPHWPLFLGRKAFVPAAPVVGPRSLRDGPPEAALRIAPWCKAGASAKPPQRLRLLLEAAEGAGAMRNDAPVSYAKGNRSFLPRFVRTDWVETATLEKEEAS